MGAWGTAIVSDDEACDVRDEFTDLIAAGHSAEEATRQLTLGSPEVFSDPDETVFWLALAATQWKLGRLLDDVRDRVLKIIESGEDLRRWQDNPASEVMARSRHLAKLKDQLHSPPRPPRKLRPRILSSTDFKEGDVAVYRLDDDLSVRFCVLRLWGDRGGTYADICLLGLNDGRPFVQKRIRLEDTLGPHFTMCSHEPADRVRIERRGVELPPRTRETFGAWNRIAINGHATTWKRFPDDLRSIVPRLGWTRTRHL